MFKLALGSSVSGKSSELSLKQKLRLILYESNINSSKVQVNELPKVYEN